MAITPNPSTYKQVLENMKKIEEVLIPNINDIVSRVDTVETTIDNTILNPPATGDIANDKDGVKVVGVSIVTSNTQINTGPKTYTKNVTYEFKQCSVIGVTAEQGFTNDYCLVVTYINDDTNVTFTPVQIAYNASMFPYMRTVSSDELLWDAWSPVIKFPDLDIRNEFVDSETEPKDQLEGEYWLGPITP